MLRGSYGFDIQSSGNLIDNAYNLERIRALFRDGAIISQKWGPGDPGDFDNGGWHSLCHLAGASAVFKSPLKYFWVGLTHVESIDRYKATVSYLGASGEAGMMDLASDAGRSLLASSVLLGYVEGTSEGHISARSIIDPPERFNGWKRQDFDRPAKGDKKEGGTVWEHWCTTRDLRPTNAVGDSVLRAYLTLVSFLGGEFVTLVIRGRRLYNHPDQLCALVKAGFVTREEALCDLRPSEIPRSAEDLFKEARPVDSLRAVEQLAWPAPPAHGYFMFKRAIKQFSDRSRVEADFRTAGI